MNISKCGCGGEAKVQRVRTLKSHVFVVMCTKCEIATNYYVTEAEAVQAWNRAMDATDINVGNKFDKDINVLIKGRWINVTTKAWVPDFQCSECGEKYVYQHNFCPNCGARMD